ncbi:LLM class flavin-dependent oxidoreductase [Streptomyces sp. NPDC094034]|uniref:LLM class flavin-dependent oxidoreductase n=1 Tax=Streptomyces sp. NPDC094034 TaxID=3155309 RepID=UPI00331C7573
MTVPSTPLPRERVGVMLPRDLPAAQVLPFARRAEELGFDELWVVEDLGFRGGVAQAGAVLAATERIVVGIGIMPAGARNPAFAAMELATLAQLFPGRLIAGIGHGMPVWMRQVGAWPASPLTFIGEYATAVRALLRGEPGPVNGRYVTTQDVVIGETPDLVPPVVLGVRGPKSLEVAGGVADGVLLAEPSPPAYIAAALGHMGTTPGAEGVEVIAYDVAVVDDDPDAALERARAGLTWIGEPDWAPHLAALPFADELARHRRHCAGPEEFAATMPAEWVAELALAGTPGQVRERVAARYRAGATSVVLTPVEADRTAALTRLARVLSRR